MNELAAVGNGAAAVPEHDNFTRSKLRDTLAELIDRQERLEPFIRESEEVAAAIKVLEKALHGTPPASGSRARMDNKTAVLAVLEAAGDAVSVPGIQAATGLGDTAHYVCKTLVKEGKAVKVGRGLYGVAPKVGTD